MGYADITFKDKNYFKRFFQRRRLRVACDEALKFFKNKEENLCILDYGCGNAELYKDLRTYIDQFYYTGYDPIEEMLVEAKANIQADDKITLTANKSSLKENGYDLIFCLEVFEHLPEAVLKQELENLNGLLSDKGIIVFGVPNEIYLAGFVRGMFRMTRRYGEFDANFKNILSSTLGRPPRNRNVNMNESGTYLYYHMGFDHRELIKAIKTVFDVEKVFGSPLPLFPTFLNTEITISCKKKK